MNKENLTSPHTATKDAKLKLALYERVGIREFWLVQTADGMVEVLPSVMTPSTENRQYMGLMARFP